MRLPVRSLFVFGEDGLTVDSGGIICYVLSPIRTIDNDLANNSDFG